MKPRIYLLGIALVYFSVLLTGRSDTSLLSVVLSQDLVAPGYRFYPLKLQPPPFTKGMVDQGGVDVEPDDTHITLDVELGTFTGLAEAGSRSGQFVLQVRSGVNEGCLLEIDEAGSSDRTIAIEGEVGFLLQDAVDTVIVVELHSLDSAFPQGGAFRAASSPGGSDLLMLCDYSGLQQVYFDSVLQKWIDASTQQERGGVALPLNSSLMILASPTPGRCVQSGLEPSGRQVVPFTGNEFTLVASPYGTINLDDLTPFVTKGSSPGGSDIIYYVNVTGSLSLAYHNGSEWLIAGSDSPVVDKQINGDGFIILAREDGEISFPEP